MESQRQDGGTFKKISKKVNFWGMLFYECLGLVVAGAGIATIPMDDYVKYLEPKKPEIYQRYEDTQVCLKSVRSVSPRDKMLGKLISNLEREVKQLKKNPEVVSYKSEVEEATDRATFIGGGLYALGGVGATVSLVRRNNLMSNYITLKEISSQAKREA